MTGPVADTPGRWGRFQSLDRLGGGGAGEVFLAEDGGTGERVAVKVARAGDRRARLQLRAEIRALADLEHPGIVRIVEASPDASPPWYAMEFLPGQSLRERLRLRDGPMSSGAAATFDLGAAPVDGTLHAPGPGRWEAWTPEALATELAVIARLCEPLGWLHARGLVHRDLKPDNVMLREDGRPVLVDFGLLTRFTAGAARVAVDVAGLRTGTVAYMAPEQIEGEIVDARADLYSLGCILFELLTGRPPFEGAMPSDLARAHLRSAVPLPSSVVGGIPAALDALVADLLQKDPARRCPYVQDVSTRLGEVLGGLGGHVEPAGPEVGRYLYRAHLCGRREAVDEVQGLLATAPLVLIEGGSGVGKSAVVAEVARRAVLAGRQVFTGAGRRLAGGVGAGGVLHPVAELMSAALDRLAEDEGDVDGATLRVLSAVDPRFGALPAAQGAPEPEELPAEAARHRLFLALATLFRATLPEGVLLVVDDLAWADELSLDLALHLLREPVDGLSLLATWRTGEREGERRVDRARLLEAGAGRLALSRLDEAAVREMVEEMLPQAGGLSPALADLAGHGGGNPLLVGELLRAALEEGALSREGGSWRLEASRGLEELLRAPSLSALVRRRLERLPEPARGVLRAAAVLGERHQVELLESISGVDATEFVSALAVLLQEGVLEEGDAGGGAEVLGFANPGLREVAYGALGEDERRGRHRAVALALEAADALSDRPKDLAHHWEQAGVPAKAAGAWEAWGSQCEAVFADEEAERAYRAGLRCEEEVATRTVIAEKLGHLLFRLGRLDEADVVLSDALREGRSARVGEPLAACLLTLAMVAHYRGELEAAVALYDELEALAEELDDDQLRARAISRRATTAHVRGRVAEARSLYEQAIEAFERLGDLRHLGVAIGNLALLLSDASDASPVPLYRRALQIHRELGNRKAEGHVLYNLAMELEDDEEVLALYDEAEAVCEEVGDHAFVAIVRTGRAIRQFRMGQVARGEQGLRDAIAQHQQYGNRQIEARTRSMLANVIRLGGGDLGAAEAELDRAQALLDAVGDTEYAGLIACRRGHLALARGQEAGPWIERARSVAEAMDAQPGSTVRVELDTLIEAAAAAPEARVHGSLPEAMAPGLRAWLRAR